MSNDYTDIRCSAALSSSRRVVNELSCATITPYAMEIWPNGKAEEAASRLLRRVEFNTVTGCLEWNGPLCHGYCEISIADEIYLGHRASWILFVGPISNEQVLHKCDNSKCVNPLHLFLGKSVDNMRDKMLKGRASKKLSESQVLEILHCYRRGTPGVRSEFSITGLSKRFNVSVQTIARIIRREIWTWIKLEETV